MEFRASVSVMANRVSVGVVKEHAKNPKHEAVL